MHIITVSGVKFFRGFCSTAQHKQRVNKRNFTFGAVAPDSFAKRNGFCVHARLAFSRVQSARTEQPCSSPAFGAEAATNPGGGANGQYAVVVFGNFLGWARYCSRAKRQ